MKIITAPTVTVISTQQFHALERYPLPPHDVATENIIAMAGKVCYDSYGIDGHSVEKHIRNLVGSGHGSVLEHAHVGLFIEGISRGCSHEIVRHRMFNYSQRSTRYTAEDDAAIVLDPYYGAVREIFDCGLASDAEEQLIVGFLADCENALTGYKCEVERLEALNPQKLTGRDLRKWCRGKARQLLPHAIETRMVMTGNLRAWRHFLVMRSSRHAEAEIRRLAAAVWAVLEPLAPTVFEDLRSETVNGYVELVAA